MTSPGVTEPGWAGQITTAPGSLTFTGAIGPAAAHAHAATQILNVTAGHIWLRDHTGTTRRTHTAIIPAGARHEIGASPGTYGTMSYHDPASPFGRAARQKLTATGGDPGTVDSWITASTAISTDTGVALVLSPELAQALTLPPMPLADLAAQVGISPSRLGHLFTERLGLTYPTWRRWARLQHALAAVTSGLSLTEAAHAAGFTDSAHLTRVCKAMFGITPSQALHAIGLRRRQAN